MTNRDVRDLATTQLRRLALALLVGDETEAAERLLERVARVDEPELSPGGAPRGGSRGARPRGRAEWAAAGEGRT